jgi:hypothetical protein
MLSVGWKQLIVFAKILAVVVFPTPREPQNKKACAKCLVLIAFFSVEVIENCPTTVSNVWGLYFRADTTKSLISTNVLICDHLFN